MSDSKILFSFLELFFFQTAVVLSFFLYGTRRFITIFTKASRLALSCPNRVNWIELTQDHVQL